VPLRTVKDITAHQHIAYSPRRELEQSVLAFADELVLHGKADGDRGPRPSATTFQFRPSTSVGGAPVGVGGGGGGGGEERRGGGGVGGGGEGKGRTGRTAQRGGGGGGGGR